MRALAQPDVGHITAPDLIPSETDAKSINFNELFLDSGPNPDGSTISLTFKLTKVNVGFIVNPDFGTVF